MLRSLIIVITHHMYSMPLYPYLATNYGTQLSYSHITCELVCIFLSFHSFGLYIHNDTMSVLSHPQDTFSDTLYNYNSRWQNCFLPIPLGIVDFLVHHIYAFTIHVAVLVLLKAVLFARISHLIPDKANLGFRFPCDGLGRGGTCQFSLMVVHYLHMTFYFFLGAHFVWVFSLMFLLSRRGYWQELIKSIGLAHNKLRVDPTTQPRAFSIVQEHVVGVTHYLLGGIATTWVFFLARIIAVG
ncbi:hypothetical protein ACOSQ3_031653 [Xanthoceras sorbifolium]